MTEQSSDLVKEAEFFFSEGILSEILSWLEVKYLLRCKLVCKLWYATINNKQFVGMHAKHDGCRSFYYISGQGERVATESINGEGILEKIRYLDVDLAGFVLVERSSLASSHMPSPKYQLINPSTKSILNLPDPLSKVVFMDIFFNSTTSSYNVISLFFDEKNKKHNFKLLDLGGQSNDSCPDANLSWRTLNITEFDEQRYKFPCIRCRGVLYILKLPQDGSSSPKIICFDIVKQQTGKIVNAPDQSLCFKWSEVLFKPCGSKPAIISVSKEKLNIWVLEDYKEQKWADMIQIPLPFLKMHPCFKNVPLLFYDDNGQILLKIGEEKLEHIVKWIFYNPKLKQRYRIPSPAMREPATLVSVKGMQPEKTVH